MTRLVKKHKSYWKNKGFLFSTFSALILLLVSIIINTAASAYATLKGTGSVTDIILSNTPTFDVNYIISYGAVIFIVIMVLFLLTRPEKLPFVAKSVSLFILIRAVFITLTHLGQFYPQAPVDGGPILDILGGGSGGGLFFSGHTGIPFLIALIFWYDPFWRWLFLGSSLLMGASVLLGHLHYSIDVLGAFFITYTIYIIAQKLFKRDYILFEKGIV